MILFGGFFEDDGNIKDSMTISWFAYVQQAIKVFDFTKEPGKP